MKAALLGLVVALVTGVAMPNANGSAFEARRLKAEASEFLSGHDRFVDGGVLLYVVEKDPKGIELLPGKPRIRIVGEHRFGGIIDTRTHEIVEESPDPIVWFNSREGAEIVLHDDSLPPKMLVEGGMGTGKTTDIGQWLWKQHNDLISFPGEFGATAPTNERTTMIQQAVMDLWPEAWWQWKERDRVFKVATGHTLRLVSTHKQSRAEGSRIQGYNWLRHAGDELQDSAEENGNIDARGRDAPHGVFKRLNSVTVKDDPQWRTIKERLLHEAKTWGLRRKSVFQSPFLDDLYIEQTKATMTEQEFRRKMGAEDLPSEHRTYYAFDRVFNVTPRPQLGARDVTQSELARFGFQGCELLMGHDPGLSNNTTIILKAFQLPKQAHPAWWVVGEVRTGPGTEVHSVQLAEYIRTRWNQRGLLYMDPHGSGKKNDNEAPDVTVKKTLTVFGERNGWIVRDAAYSAGKATPGQVPQVARIDMVNTLFRSAQKDEKGEHLRRLFIDCDERGSCKAPGLLNSIEIQENVHGKAETQPKGFNDPTGYTTSLGYALWPIEKPRLDDIRARGRA